MSTPVVKKIQPSERLAPYILNYFYFSSEVDVPRDLTEPAMGNMILTVVAEGRGDFSNSNHSKKIGGVQVFGPHKNPNRYTIYGPRFTMLNIILKPVGASLLFNINPTQFTDDVIDLNDLIPPAKRTDLEDLVGSVHDTVLLKEYLDAFFIQLLPKQNHIYKSILASDLLNYLHQSYGRVTMKETLDYFNTSEQYLRRRFNEYVGISPKQYARVLNFREDFLKFFVEEEPEHEDSPSEYFYDQSHRIRTYKEFTGYTPKALPKELFSMTYLFLKMTKAGERDQVRS